MAVFNRETREELDSIQRELDGVGLPGSLSISSERLEELTTRERQLKARLNEK